MEREDGYYWIKHYDDETWQIAQYATKGWWLFHENDTYYEDFELAEIDEHRIKDKND